MIAEPTADEAISMLHSVRGQFEMYHKVRIEDKALATTVELAPQYTAARR